MVYFRLYLLLLNSPCFGCRALCRYLPPRNSRVWPSDGDASSRGSSQRPLKLLRFALTWSPSESTILSSRPRFSLICSVGDEGHYPCGVESLMRCRHCSQIRRLNERRSREIDRNIPPCSFGCIFAWLEAERVF